MTTGKYEHKPHSEETKQKMRKLHKAHSISPDKIRAGENHPSWKGDEVGLTQIHQWVMKHKVKSPICEECGKEGKLYLANIKNHQYTRNPDDYKWLCASCHQLLDRKVCKRGHDLTNVPLDSRGKRVCKECKKIYNKNYKNRVFGTLANADGG